MVWNGDDMSTEPTHIDFPSGDVTIAAYRWDPEGEPRAIAQLAHGVGEYAERYAPLAHALTAAFQPPGTDFDWLSRDDAQVDASIADPRCGFGHDVSGGRAMFVAAWQMADTARVAGMRKDLPVYLVVGTMDPVNGGMVLVDELVRRYEEAGLDDVTLVGYPEARHEVFNETNRTEVVDGTLAWLDTKVGG